jgi:hypothetical protein
MKYPVRVVLLTSYIFCCASVLSQTATTQTPRPKPTLAQAKVELAVWNDTAEKDVGLTEANFKEAGLRKLTQAEYRVLLSWIEDQYASRIKNATDLVNTFSCGRPFNVLDSYDKVKLFLEFSDKSPSELVSGIRERFRNKKDVEIVFDEKDADVVARILAFYSETESGHRTGFTVSVVTLQHCREQLKALNVDSEFEKFNGDYLQTSPGSTEAIEQVVSTLDANDIEEARKTNAWMKKAAEATKQH